MITPSEDFLEQQTTWQQDMAQAMTDPVELLRTLNLPNSLLDKAQQAAKDFPLRLTRHYLSLIEHGNVDDPLLRQILPIQAELQPVPGYSKDPVGDAQASLGDGLLHKYAGRALLVTTGACAIHCRYCFRRHYPYANNSAIQHWEAMLQQLRDRPALDEIILSGGDPLTLSDSRLLELIQQIEAIPHVKRLRIHSRLPIVLPKRITHGLVDKLANSHLHSSLVVHCNHAQELSPALLAGLQQLQQAGVTLLNQSVLLAGVNDNLATLKALCEQLFAYGILPYYLHQLDPVQGAAHFAVDDQQAIQLHSTLRKQLPGYLLPRLVREITGESAKTPL